MSDLLLVEKRLINNVIVDGFYRDEQALFNRFQIGSALEYTDPAIAIAKIHKRHKERLDQFSFLYQSGKGASKREMGDAYKKSAELSNRQEITLDEVRNFKLRRHAHDVTLSYAVITHQNEGY